MTEPGFERDIGTIEIWLIDWLMVELHAMALVLLWMFETIPDGKKQLWMAVVKDYIILRRERANSRRIYVHNDCISFELPGIEAYYSGMSKITELKAFFQKILLNSVQ